MWRRVGLLGIVAVFGVGCVGDDAADEAEDTAATTAETVAVTDPAAAANQICPVLWDWQLAMGAAFNGAADDVATIDDAVGRRARWAEALDEMEQLDRSLIDDVQAFADDAILGEFVDAVESGIPVSLAEIDDIRMLFEERPEFDEERHQTRTQQVIIRFEKVIDVVKPELAEIDRALIPAFQAVESCHHSVKDAAISG